MTVREYTTLRMYAVLQWAFPYLAPTDAVLFVTTYRYYYLQPRPLIRHRDGWEESATTSPDGKHVDLEQFAFGDPPFHRMWLAHVPPLRQLLVYDEQTVRSDAARASRAQREREIANYKGEPLPMNTRLKNLMKHMRETPK